ncbi:MAG: SLBB domain-containing protein [Chloroflexota bacterium]
MFGRELFLSSSTAAPLENAPVGPDYVLGPGDNLMVFVSGRSDTSYSITLDREGKVFLPRIGSTFLWGMSFASAEDLIRARLGTILRSARIQISMGRVRAIEVFVLGAVRNPGKLTLTGMGTAFHALAAAGGPADLGSLRDIRVFRTNRPIAVLDLYPFLTAGDRSNDTRLQTGDVVFVGLAKSRVGIQGAVVRPGVYESDGPLSLRALLELAGGTTPFADIARIRVERVDANGGFRLQDLPLNHGRGVDPDSLALENYDLVTVLSLNERVGNAITLDGFVRHPGPYELAAGMRLSQLVTADRLLPEAALDEAEVRRIDPATFRVDVRPFSVRRLWNGEGDFELQPLDAVTIFSSARLPGSVTLDGEVTRPGTYTISPGELLSSLLERAGGITPRGWLPAALFTRRSAAVSSRAHLRDFVERQRVDLARQQSRAAQAGDSAAAAAAMRAQMDLTGMVERQVDPGRVALDLDPPRRWQGTARDPVLEDGDRLLVPQKPATVAVLGNVMNPGTHMARPGALPGAYVKLAGGAARDADLHRSYVLKANGEAIPYREARVEQGDAIIVMPRELGGTHPGRILGGVLRTAVELAGAAAVVVIATR